jgi:hypothetical protein
MAKWLKIPKTYGGLQDNIAYEKALSTPTKEEKMISLFNFSTKIFKFLSCLWLALIILGFSLMSLAPKVAGVIGATGSFLFVVNFISYICLIMMILYMKGLSNE